MVFEIFATLTENLISLVNQLGYIGIFIGMTIESSFFPFPSEVVLIPAGTLVARGEMNFLLVLFFGVLGSMLGAWINYSIALFFGRNAIDALLDKYGKFLFLNKNTLRKTDIYFKKNGEITTFVGRLIFVIRQLISLPAGFARMKFTKFTLYTVLGAAVWSTTLISVGYFFGSNFQPIMKIVTGILLAVSLIIVLVYYYLKKKRKR